MTNQQIQFRSWLQNMWFQHKDELATYGEPCNYDSREYFARYKYWLKREFRYQTRG